MFTVTQNGKQTVSFMSQALGLMADLDIGTQHLRWMGDARFMYGFIRGRKGQPVNPDYLSYRLNYSSCCIQTLSHTTVHQGRRTGQSRDGGCFAHPPGTTECRY